MNTVRFLWIFLMLFVLSCNVELPDEVDEEYSLLVDQVDFNQHVKPILSDKCFLCHGPDSGTRKAGMRFDTENGLFEKTMKGNFPVKPGNLGKSEAVHRILSDDPSYIMPPPESHLTLTAYEKAVLIKWVEQGAPWKKHWSFISPEKQEIPTVENTKLISNSIDNFILNKLESKGLEFSKPGDKELLLRRLSFDLIGLPPSLEELDAYLKDASPDAYEKQVDRLLASPHYGEQRAANWMDLSRFADTHGYSVDRYRDMSPWRDWVIKAFNDNMAYDQFVTWQLAGDLMENPSKEMILATAFNRIHPQNMEGGIVEEEFLVEYAVDRTNTFGQAFLALSLECSRCHDHKFDPVSQEEFYQMTDYFNNINEAGQISFNNAMPTPTMLLSTEEEEEMTAYMEHLMSGLESKIDSVQKMTFDTTFQIWLESEVYKKQLQLPQIKNQVAYFDLNGGKLKNELAPFQKGTMKRESQENQAIDLTEGWQGDGIRFDGDTWLDLKNTAVFDRTDAFSIGFWANIPQDLKNGNILHKGSGAVLFGWRGYHLKIVDDKLELMMAHTAPDNTITKISRLGFPRNEWVHFMMSYDGSSKASGFKLFINGNESETIVKVDNLFKNILFGNKNEPGLQFGARLRGKGIKGAIVDEIRVFDKELSDLDILKLSGNEALNVMMQKRKNNLSPSDLSLLHGYYVKNVYSGNLKNQEELKKLRVKYADSVEGIQEVMVMKELEEPNRSFVLERGVYYAKGKEVIANTPKAILPMDQKTEKNRLGLASWLFDEKHPLTSRVTVNRYWQNYFGKGLVKSSDDFGNQGEMPSHPALLDWLSMQFVESGWDVKAIQKMMVMSNTYRQTSVSNEELFLKDPENSLLARGPSKRLSGEMLRDNALASSGLMNDKIGGKSVYPYQPQGLWSLNGARYKESKGDDLYRRSLYTIWKRSMPNPSIATFDAPARDICTVRRQETNTPIQALVLLNDPTFIEASRALGYEMAKSADVKEGIKLMFRKLTGRKITEKELKLLLELQQEEYQKFKNNPDKSKGWMNLGTFQVEDQIPLVAANAIVASTIMNADATITKR